MIPQARSPVNTMIRACRGLTVACTTSIADGVHSRLLSTRPHAALSSSAPLKLVAPLQPLTHLTAAPAPFVSASVSASASFHTTASSSSSSQSSSASSSSLPVVSIAICGSVLLVTFLSSSTAECSAATSPSASTTAAAPTPGAPAQPPPGGWPEYSAEEVAKHCTPASRIWVSYRDGVYDITDFIPLHPGGTQKIMLGAGAAIDPFWALYRQHDHQTVRDILAQYRIGALKGYNTATAASTADPYESDPSRHPALHVNSQKPFNAEPPLDVLAASYITPNDLFFVRNHLPVPHVDASAYRLKVGGIGLVERSYTLDELLQHFPQHEVTATLQCAGNRRSEMNKIKVVKGLNWGQAAISNAQWRGVRLRDVLESQGLTADKVAASGVKHVHFKGLDSDPTGTTYAASVPIEKVFDGSSDVLLATEMNGSTLPVDHGYPLRAIVPGVVGARNVKWLGEVSTERVESPGHWQQNDYKGFSPNVDWDNVDFSTAPAIQELPVTSAICEPAAGTKIDHDTDELTVKGYAYSGGGRGIVRVDVTADGGASWYTAVLHPPTGVEAQPLNRSWGWTPWSINLPLSNIQPGQRDVTLACKAVDASYNTQPENFAHVWNLRGCLSNAWHKVPLQVDSETETEKKSK